jgi:superfamily I DNA/RNA helicase/mRNA-degrading endonuclease RelE of RelBE toxin-antitoxin system
MANIEKNISIAISADFLKSFANIPRSQQSKVSQFINKFRNNPTASGINYEKINAAKDKNLRSIRIDQAYRGIVLKPELGNIYLLLYVDNHDNAYDWAKNKTFNINPHTGGLQVVDVDSATGAVKPQRTADRQTGLFAKVKDKQLLVLGVPEALLPTVRSINSENQLDKATPYLPDEAVEALYALASGLSYEDAYNEAERVRAENIPNIDVDDFAATLTNPDTLRRFHVVEDDTEMMALLNAPLEQWRVFLHPSQRALVKKYYNGPVRVLGGAGTGKTVVALHRAKWLAQEIFTNPDDKILFTTFTKNLAEDIRDNLKKICSTELLKRIEVKNIDAWVNNFLKSRDYAYTISYLDNTLDEYWDDAINLAGKNSCFSKEFFLDEWTHVIQAQGIAEEQAYLRASRLGRGVRINRKTRKAIWPVFEEYRCRLNENNRKEFIDAVRDARVILKTKGDIQPYRAVVVDEAQDMPAEVFRLIRELVPLSRAQAPDDNLSSAVAPEAKGIPNDIFIVGDAHQRIYEHKITLSKCGINIRGRGKRLKINYRTTEEIRDWAVALLEGKSIDDLDGGYDSGKGYKSLTHGIRPEVKSFPSFKEEFAYIMQNIDNLKNADIPLASMCIVARRNRDIDQYQGALNAAGIETYKVKHKVADDPTHKGVRLATMHRVKGIEFDYVHIAAVNADIIPLPVAIDDNPKAKLDHELRERALLYVAATRARKALYISAFASPSPFIQKQ